MYPRSGTGQSAEERGGIYDRTVSEHLTNIFASGELDEEAAIRKLRIAAAAGKTYATQHYSLDAIISVGYRGNSVRETPFRRWATSVQHRLFESDFDRVIKQLDAGGKQGGGGG